MVDSKSMLSLAFSDCPLMEKEKICYIIKVGRVAKWSKAAVCKTAIRRFDSDHGLQKTSESSGMRRALPDAEASRMPQWRAKFSFYPIFILPQNFLPRFLFFLLSPRLLWQDRLRERYMPFFHLPRKFG